ncbi:NLR family CARD domain-containing protein 4 [Holothuria leucospilota]|uniref:NLR family CARD domain-containing protein 4 n=1 Tax=Holothuria leucospilota TaxID=206669 RepID=A0A9Q1CP88_HOLLE|nr:NLR family CARD domain-containing protein 4 [Holothuria leucospilota]
MQVVCNLFPILTHLIIFTARKDIFISELKEKYNDLYESVKPIPYIRDGLYCIDRVFVEGGIEYLVAEGKMNSPGTWAKLSSYNDILNDDRVKSTRRILEGEPGYGKSTITLQFAYDWCNKVQTSYLKNTDIFILLRLRQLGGVNSIYTAIKRFLLPKDSTLTESDIENILSDSTSVVLILDGYDEYPDQNSDSDSIIVNILTKELLQPFEVILTTRASCLPKKYSASTKRLRLTGFDDKVRTKYIQKAVVGNDSEATQKIKKQLDENPDLRDLCQVPLFFVMFAHMSNESRQFQKINNVTFFFRYMISCFHSHMRNKMKDENVQSCHLKEADHMKLDDLAFEGLSGKNQQIVWTKEDIRERLGQDFLNQYLRIGVLVEEEVIDISDNPSLKISDHIQYKTEVRFYHRLFCEWYAAHHLAKYASRDDVKFTPCGEGEEKDEQKNMTTSDKDVYLKSLDPFNLHYVYRFACGLDPTAAEKIIAYLESRKDAEKVAILCLLEQGQNITNLLETVQKLCSREVTIYDNDSLLLQKSTVKLLEIAETNKVRVGRNTFHFF